MKALNCLRMIYYALSDFSNFNLIAPTEIEYPHSSLLAFKLAQKLSIDIVAVGYVKLFECLEPRYL